jgi:hypothetical protein
MRPQAIIHVALTNDGCAPVRAALTVTANGDPMRTKTAYLVPGAKVHRWFRYRHDGGSDDLNDAEVVCFTASVEALGDVDPTNDEMTKCTAF